MTVLEKQSTPWQVTLFLLAGHLGSLIVKIQVLIISTDYLIGYPESPGYLTVTNDVGVFFFQHFSERAGEI